MLQLILTENCSKLRAKNSHTRFFFLSFYLLSNGETENHPIIKRSSSNHNHFSVIIGYEPKEKNWFCSLDGLNDVTLSSVNHSNTRKQ